MMHNDTPRSGSGSDNSEPLLLVASIVVNRRHELVHLSHSAGRYLQRRGGQPSQNILKEVRPQLRLELQAALRKVFINNRSVATGPIQVPFDGEPSFVHVIVKPGQTEDGTQDQALVIFVEVDETISTERDADRRESRDGTPEYQNLQEEVQSLHKRLQTTIEEYESSQEQMKAANEELQSINEENKSTSEELETSKEELHSVNEELQTVNQELKGKVAELSQINDDLRNLMAATEIGTLFLDRDLRIKRFTPPITKLFNVMSRDLGRPIKDFTREINYDNLTEDAARVLRDLVPKEREVYSQDESRCYLGRLRPYRTADDRIQGVVITFVDITKRCEKEEGRRKAEERFRLLMENVKEYAIIMLDRGGRITNWNIGAQRLFGYGEEEATGQPSALLSTEADRKAGVPQKKLEDATMNGQASDDRLYRRKDGSRFWGTGVISALYHPDGELRGFAKVMRDNTETKQVAESLEERVEQRTRQVRELASTLTMAEQQERRRISRILHDDVQQRLYCVKLKLELAKENLQAGREQQDELRDNLMIADAWLDETMVVSRRLSVDLSPPVLKEEGLLTAFEWLATQVKEMHDLEVEVKAEESIHFPDEDMGVLLYQIVRELLFNVAKHAHTDHATVELEEKEGELIIRVSDSGCGFDLEDLKARGQIARGSGLLNIDKRLDLFGGRMEIDTAPGRGTRLTLHAPLVS